MVCRGANRFVVKTANRFWQIRWIAGGKDKRIFVRSRQSGYSQRPRHPFGSGQLGQAGVRTGQEQSDMSILQRHLTSNKGCHCKQCQCCMGSRGPRAGPPGPAAAGGPAPGPGPDRIRNTQPGCHSLSQCLQAAAPWHGSDNMTRNKLECSVSRRARRAGPGEPARRPPRA